MKSDKSTPNVPTLRFPDFSEEWRSTPMKNVCSFAKGYGIAKENLSAEGTPCILYGELYTYYKTAIAKDIRSKTQLDPTDLFHSKANDVIIPCSGETAIDIATSVCVPYDDVLLGGDLTVIRTKLNGAFLSNQLNSVRRKKIATIAQGASIVHLHADELKNGIIHIRKTIQRIYINDNGTKKTELLIDTPKTATSMRDIPMIKDLYDLLKPLKKVVRNDYYVLTNDAMPTEPRTYRNYYKKLLKRLGIPPIKFHGLRHSFATRCIESKCDYKTVSVILGHSDISTTLNLYVHPNYDQKKKCIDKMFKSIKNF